MAERASSYHIDTVEPLPFETNALAAASIDIPSQGQQGAQTVLRIAGWVLGAEGRAGSVLVSCGGLPLITTAVDVERRDVAAHFGRESAARSGFTVQLNTLLLPSRFELEVSAWVEQGSRRIPFAKICGEHRPVQPRYVPDLKPLLVMGPGRSGTTILMRYLHLHPEVVADTAYPYELVASRYWLRLLEVLTSDADMEHSTTPATLSSDHAHIGHHPYNSSLFSPTLAHWFSTSYVDQTARFALQSIDDCYKSLRQEGRSGPARFFAEKLGITELYWLLSSVYPQARFVVLVRDPRDRHASVEAFNTKRGFDGFSVSHFKSEVARLQYEKILMVFLRRELQDRPESCFLVRYEDLMLDTENTLQRTFERLGMTTSPALVKSIALQASEDIRELREHRTTPSPRDSVGRWRRDMPPAIQELYTTHLREELTAFGYDT